MNTIISFYVHKKFPLTTQFFNGNSHFASACFLQIKVLQTVFQFSFLDFWKRSLSQIFDKFCSHWRNFTVIQYLNIFGGSEKSGEQNKLL